jgi:quercetin dioxygenase-like cupin family protein
MPLIPWEQLEIEEVVPGLRRRVFATDHLTAVYWMMSAGLSLPDHCHEQDQLDLCLGGEVHYRCGNESGVLREGSWLLNPAGVPHGGAFPVDTVLLSIYSPARRDIVQGTDQPARAATLLPMGLAGR